MRKLVNKTISRVAFALGVFLFLAGVANAQELKEYWNSKFNYGIAYPAGWTIATKGAFFEQETFSLLNQMGDLNVNVMAVPFSSENRGRFHNITDVPNVKQELLNQIKDGIGPSNIKNGNTVISNEPAIWFTYSFPQKSLDKEFWFSVYQLSILKNDIIYTITAKVVDRTKNMADVKLEKNWNIIKNTISTFTFSK